MIPLKNTFTLFFSPYFFHFISIYDAQQYAITQKKIITKFTSRKQVKGQYSNADDTIEDEINAIERALAENSKYEMHRRALEKIFGGLLNSYARDADYYEQAEDDEKRSIATLAKNGQLPSREPDTEMDSIGEDDNGHKRNIASMARTGMIGGKRNIQSIARQLQYSNGKRNIGSLMRNNMFPGSGKRNIASLARSGFGKRNVGTLARDWVLPKLNSGLKYADGM